MEGYWWGGGKKRIEKRVQGLRNIIGKVQNRQGEVTNSTGHGEAKELTCMTHGHELRQRGISGENGCTEWKGE